MVMKNNNSKGAGQKDNPSQEDEDNLKHFIEQDNEEIPNIAIVISHYYPKISKMLEKGAVAALKNKDLAALVGGKLTYQIFKVPGALESPAAIATLSRASDEDGSFIFHGYVALGCVIRGETSHYDIVSQQSAAALMRLSTKAGLSIGNGILTVENEEQALVRADPKQGNKGFYAAEACLSLLGLQMTYEVSPMEYIDEQAMNSHRFNVLEPLLRMVSAKINHDDDDDEDDDDDDDFNGQDPN